MPRPMPRSPTCCWPGRKRRWRVTRSRRMRCRCSAACGSLPPPARWPAWNTRWPRRESTRSAPSLPPARLTRATRKTRASTPATAIPPTLILSCSWRAQPCNSCGKPAISRAGLYRNDTMKETAIEASEIGIRMLYSVGSSGSTTILMLTAIRIPTSAPMPLIRNASIRNW